MDDQCFKWVDVKELDGWWWDFDLASGEDGEAWPADN
jgi:hypothetical protein